MITLYHHPVSPFCITIRMILCYAKAEHRVVDLPYSDRRVIIEKTGGNYYKIPIIEDGKTIVWDRTELGQEIARYLDDKFRLDLFPPALEGIQSILSRYIESDVEGVAFKLNDIHYESWLPDVHDRTMWLRHKERKFGSGCISQWHANQGSFHEELEECLKPLEQMLSVRPFLIDESMRFVDCDLFGVIGNLMFSGHNAIPTRFSYLHRWHSRVATRCGTSQSAKT
ncbi:hypothetical protein W02_39480 [Nitrospira sp. KM1]|uniref:glutathione S-transferase family protein n=1 Tax=Nitrospira sp. KM1 TaxID=1936990 RepID=UPI0013A72996|nr:glutathione S-transferase family protein [Nitrospira sp. KM1]BCA56808.1 hypothetical protein W02_39480 [Nitrospira sp. KM1]